MEEADLRSASSRTDSLVQDAEHEELLVALRAGFARLADDDRHMVALHYGAGLTCEQIAADSEMPARTVAYRMQKALENLRASLVRTGFAAAAPLLGAGEVGEAVTTGFEVPDGLKADVLNNLAGKAGASAAEHSRRAGGVAGSSGAVVSLVVAVTACAVTWYALQPARSSQLSQTETASAGTPPTRAPAQPERIRKAWNFEQGPHDELKVAKGAWAWAPAEGQRPAGMRCTGGETLVRLPIKVADNRLWRVNMRVLFEAGDLEKAGAWASWQTYSSPDRTVVMYSRFSTRIRPGSRIHATTYLLPEHDVILYYLEGDPVEEPSGITVGHRSGGVWERIILVGLNNCLVQEIEIQDATREEIPGPFRDAEQLIKEKRLKLMTLAPFAGKKSGGESQAEPESKRSKE